MRAMQSGWLTAEAILLIVLGIAALVLPPLAGVTATLLVGWILIVSGVIGIASGFGAASHAHRGLSLLSGAIALVVGVLILVRPVAGALGLTLLLAAYLVLDGLTLIGLALTHRPRAPTRWGWLLVSGIADLILAGFLTFLTPAGATFIIGVVVGIDLILAGVALLMVQRAGLPVVP
jgi:uncharacterized membrane protein HdeD (DUF308 family)